MSAQLLYGHGMRPRVVMGLWLALTCSLVWAEDYTLRLRLDTRNFSDAVPFKQIAAEFNGYENKIARPAVLSRQAVELRIEQGPWSMGVAEQSQIFVKGNREAWEVLALYAQPGSNPEVGARQIAIEGYGIHRRSLRVEHSEVWLRGASSVVKGRLGLNTGVVKRFRSVQASGVASVLSQDRYAFDVVAQDADTRADFAFPANKNDQGVFASLDLGMDIEGQRWAWRNQFRDLVNLTRIDHMPVTDIVVQTDNAQVRADGRVEYKPALRGLNRVVDRRFRVPATWFSELAYGLGAGWGSVFLGWTAVPGMWIPEVGHVHDLGGGVRLTTRVDLRYGSLGARVESGSYSVGVFSDSLKIGAARAYGLQAQWVKSLQF